MNTVMRQYREQDTDIVIIDTGDSYEGLCSYFDGTYISYSKEKPISMNPFKVTDAEYNENFGEKKNFLKSLIFQLFKGAEFPTKLEDAVINQTIVEYYEEYFHPFEGFNEEERKEMKNKLLLEDKKNGEYDKFEEELEERYGDEYEIEELEYKKLSDRDKRVTEKLKAVIEDKAATDGEKEVAQRALQRLTPEVIENKYLMRIEHQIDKIERQKKKLKVTELSFNSYYEFAVERIPQIMKLQNIQFNIHDFATILQAFYKGGENESILNNDIDGSLFDEKFIVFEIDKVKDDPVLFPILTLIIMDVFTQKMRIKKGRKCLVIEEAWKAIATPVMADYIKYLYKTARKHWAMVGVVTQEIQDITSSPIVKEAIINNSDVFMLLDQSKFKDKFDDIKATLSLTDIDCKKIFTINRLDNHEGRSRFQEVFIKRGQDGEVYGVEEPPECYINYTTEKVEKEAFKFYRKQLKGSYQHGIEVFVKDWKDSGLDCTSFAKLVMKEGKMYNQMNKNNMFMRRIIVLILMSAVIQTVSALGWHNINVDLKTITAMGTAYGVEGAEEGNTATALDSIFQHYKSGGIAMAGIFVSKKNDRDAMRNPGLFASEENYYYKRIYSLVKDGIMPKFITVAAKFLKYPENVLYWGPYLLKTTSNVENLCKEFELVATNGKLSFKDIKFLVVSDELKKLFDLAQLGNVDWKALLDKLGDFGKDLSKDELKEDMKHFGDVIASAGQQTVDANLEKASKIGNIFHSSTDSIWMMYDKFRDTYEQVKNGANVKDLLMQVIVTPDAAGVARLFKIDDYNLTGYITNYLKELKGQYYTQRWYIYTEDSGTKVICAYKPDSYEDRNDSRWNMAWNHYISPKDNEYCHSLTTAEKNEIKNKANSLSGWNQEKVNEYNQIIQGILVV